MLHGLKISGKCDELTPVRDVSHRYSLQGGLIIRIKVERDAARINEPTNLRRRSDISVLKRQRSRFGLRNRISKGAPAIRGRCVR